MAGWAAPLSGFGEPPYGPAFIVAALSSEAVQMAQVSARLQELAGSLAALRDDMEVFASSLEFGAEAYERAELYAVGAAAGAAAEAMPWRADRLQVKINEAGEAIYSQLSRADWRRRFVSAATSESPLVFNWRPAFVWANPDYKRDVAMNYMVLAKDRWMLERNADTPIERSAALLSGVYPRIEQVLSMFKGTLKMQPSDGRGPALVWSREAYKYGLEGFDMRTHASIDLDLEPRAEPEVVAAETPILASALVARVDSLAKHPTGGGVRGPKSTHGEFEILRHENEGERPSWSVIVRGTQEWLPGTANPKDMQANLLLMAGLPTDEEAAIMTALELEGAKPGDSVEVAGHSQGGLVAGALASKPVFAGKYEVAAVVTAGSPIATMNIPANTPVLSFENADDIVPALEGEPVRTSKSHIAVYSPGRGDGAHSIIDYSKDALEAEALSNADLEAWNRRRVEALGITEGTETTSRRYTITRR